MFLFSIKYFGKKIVWTAGAYMVTVWFAVVYLGDHYVFDVVMGILYAGLTFVVVNRIFDKFMGSRVQQQWSAFDGWLQSAQAGTILKQKANQ